MNIYGCSSINKLIILYKYIFSKVLPFTIVCQYLRTYSLDPLKTHPGHYMFFYVGHDCLPGLWLFRGFFGQKFVQVSWGDARQNWSVTQGLIVIGDVVDCGFPERPEFFLVHRLIGIERVGKIDDILFSTIYSRSLKADRRSSTYSCTFSLR